MSHFGSMTDSDVSVSSWKYRRETQDALEIAEENFETAKIALDRFDEDGLPYHRVEPYWRTKRILDDAQSAMNSALSTHIAWATEMSLHSSEQMIDVDYTKWTNGFKTGVWTA